MGDFQPQTRSSQHWALTREAHNESRREGMHKGKNERRKSEERKRLEKTGRREKGSRKVGAGSGDPGWVLTSCCAGAGTPERGPWGSALGAGSGTGRGQGWQERPTLRLAESCGRRARSTATAHCCGKGAGLRGPCSPAQAWAPRYSCHRSLATPWEEKLRYSERPWPTSMHACCLGETCNTGRVFLVQSER